MALLEVEDLTVRYYTEEGVVTAVDGLTYRLERGETLGVVGESGAGKTVACRAIMGLVDAPGHLERGSVRLCDPAVVDRLAAEHPDCVVDVDRLRADHDARTLARRDPATAGSLPADPDVVDLLESGRAADLGLVEPDDFLVVDGDRRYVELTRAPAPVVRSLRGRHLAMVFQDPDAALNPVYTAGEQVAETIRHHRDAARAEARARTVRLFEAVGIPDPQETYSAYPHQLSGGMAQRVVVAMALSCEPSVLLCDEPTTALDVTVEAQLLSVIEDLTAELDTAVQLVTHDLGVVAGHSDRVMVMYAGRQVERAPVEALYHDPKHPYTVGLLSAIPRIGDPRDRLQTIPGTMPELTRPTGCRFHPRCPYAEDACRRSRPPLVDPDTGEPAEADDDRAAACLEYTGDLTGGLTYEVEVGEPSGERHD